MPMALSRIKRYALEQNQVVRPAEILRCLGLAGASWALGCSPHHQVQALGQGDVAPRIYG